MSLRWNDDENIRFVTLYKHCKCLWQSENPNYSKQKIRTQAYEFIQEKMGLESTEIVRRKIKSFRDTYLCERKKIKNSERLCRNEPDSEIYTPRVKWFTVMDSFIGQSGYNVNEPEFVPNYDYTKTNADDTCTTSAKLEVVFCDEDRQATSFLDEVNNDNDDSNLSTNNFDSNPTKRQKTDDINNEEDYENHLFPESTNNKPPINNRNHIESIQYDDRGKTATNNLSIYDEFYHFGMNIAHQLRSMPINDALECQTDIMDYLVRKRKHIHTKNVNGKF